MWVLQFSILEKKHYWPIHPPVSLIYLFSLARCSLLQKGHTGRGGSFPSDPGYSLCRSPGNGDRETATQVSNLEELIEIENLDQALRREITNSFNKDIAKTWQKMDNKVTRHAKAKSRRWQDNMDWLGEANYTGRSKCWNLMFATIFLYQISIICYILTPPTK